MKVLYYTFTPFLDCALELINVLKQHVELHVVIEISPETSISNILDVGELPSRGCFLNPSKLLNEESYKRFQPYLAGTASANFLVYSQKRSFSFSTLRESFKLSKFIRKLKPDVVHFEGFSQRSLGAIPFLRSVEKIFFTVHDPLPHSGEFNWRVSLAKFFYFKLAKGFFFYSKFACNQFTHHYRAQEAPKRVLKLYPYHFYKNYSRQDDATKKHVLFFGRISPYKGIEVLLNAMPALLKEDKGIQLVVAGKSVNGYAIDEKVLKQYKQNIHVIDKYLSNEELVSLIQEAQVVVCPYKDATQSGVLMTAYALGTPVIATEVGAFPEYIINNINGMLFPVGDSVMLANRLKEVLKDGGFHKLEQNIKARGQHENWNRNLPILIKAYKEG